MTDDTWVKASRCSQDGCVEQRRTPGDVEVRDSKTLTHPRIKTMTTDNTITWVRASARCGAGQSCIEQGAIPGGVQIRDSKHSDSPILTFTTAEYAAWIDAAKNGEFDHLI